MTLNGVRTRWQIKTRIFGWERWFDMDDWLHEHTNAFFTQHRNELNEYRRRRREEGLTEGFRPSHFQTTHQTRIYEGTHRGYVWDFMGNTFGDTYPYAVIDMTTGDSFAIRLIRYEVLAPANRY